MNPSCRELNIKLCPNCDVVNIPTCWIIQFIKDHKRYHLSNKEIIQSYFKLKTVNEYNSGYWYREALKITNPNVVEEIDKLTILY